MRVGLAETQRRACARAAARRSVVRAQEPAAAGTPTQVRTLMGRSDAGAAAVAASSSRKYLVMSAVFRPVSACLENERARRGAACRGGGEGETGSREGKECDKGATTQRDR